MWSQVLCVGGSSGMKIKKTKKIALKSSNDWFIFVKLMLKMTLMLKIDNFSTYPINYPITTYPEKKVDTDLMRLIVIKKKKEIRKKEKLKQK